MNGHALRSSIIVVLIVQVASSSNEGGWLHIVKTAPLLTGHLNCSVSAKRLPSLAVITCCSCVGVVDLFLALPQRQTRTAWGGYTIPSSDGHTL